MSLILISVEAYKTNLIKLLFLLLLSVTPFINATSQILKGTVISESGAVVPYASVRIKGQPSSGTITNLDGYFKLNLGKNLDKDSLLISHIGEGFYSNTIENTRTLDTIQLQQKDISLSEVTISPSSFNAQDTVQKALAHYSKNHWVNDVQLTAFFREYGAQDGKWGRFFEAALTVENFGSLQLNEEMKIAVNQARKSIDAFENTKDATNPFFILYRPLKFNLSEQLFDYIGVEQYEDKLVYVIRFHKPGKDGEYEGELFLDSRNLSFLEIRAHLSPQGKNKVRNKGWAKIHGKIRRYKNFRRKENVIVKFKTYKDKNILSTILREVIWTAEAKKDKFVYDYISNFLVTGIKEQFPPIKETEAIEKREDLLTKDFPYSESFWQDYTHLVADKKQQEILNALTPVR